MLKGECLEGVARERHGYRGLARRFLGTSFGYLN